jgi:hypothetical protein
MGLNRGDISSGSLPEWWHNADPSGSGPSIRGAIMEHHVGIDVSLELSSLCVLDATGKVIREAKVASEPEALVAFLRGLGLTIVRVGLEAGPLSQWLYDGLQAAGFEPVLLETRHVKAALSAMTIKTDRRDARGIAQLLRMGWYRPVHRKSVPSQEVRALLAARKQMQIKAMDLEQTLRGLLRGFGLKVGDVSRGKLAARFPGRTSQQANPRVGKASTSTGYQRFSEMPSDAPFRVHGESQGSFEGLWIGARFKRVLEQQNGTKLCKGDIPAFSKAEAMLISRWPWLGQRPRFFQLALFHATLRLLELTAEAVAVALDPKLLFRLITSNFYTHGISAQTRAAERAVRRRTTTWRPGRRSGLA